ncbi:MAG: DNA gyrase inhibitor YacG [Deltaproteobacteria bacterium]|nr:DNA gyrase inhibitor YacG [Deltaproteobacteria bacterium]
MAICPICTTPVGSRSQNPLFPFCSERCKAIDLGNWLGERYRVPQEDQALTDGSEGDDADFEGSKSH